MWPRNPSWHPGWTGLSALLPGTNLPPKQCSGRHSACRLWEGLSLLPHWTVAPQPAFVFQVQGIWIYSHIDQTNSKVCPVDRAGRCHGGKSIVLEGTSAERSKETVQQKPSRGYDCSIQKAEACQMKQTNMLHMKQEESDTSTVIAEYCIS